MTTLHFDLFRATYLAIGKTWRLRFLLYYNFFMYMVSICVFVVSLYE